MWAAGGFALVVAGLLPTAWRWLAHAQSSLAQETVAAYQTDSMFLVGAGLFLWIAVKYGQNRGPVSPAPYPGAFVEADGRQRCPRGFTPGYLSLALVVALIIPALLLTFSSATARPIANATLGPYLLVFIPQILLETNFLNRSFMTPVLPVLFMFYRLWQFIRSLGLAARHSAAAAAAAGTSNGSSPWIILYLLSLLSFWVFDTGCTLIWMPWMYDWQLQDPSRLQHLARLREQQQLLLLQGSKGSGSLLPAKVSDTGLAARGGGEQEEGRGLLGQGAATAFGSSGAARHRRGGAGSVPAGPPPPSHHEVKPSGCTDDYDSFGFGT